MEPTIPANTPEPEATIKVSARDWDGFMAALDNPPEPNDALKKLMKEFGPWTVPATKPTE
jgi:uncharacterized protein (DUF1778 family)